MKNPVNDDLYAFQKTKMPNGPENQMISKVVLGEQNFFKTAAMVRVPSLKQGPPHILSSREVTLKDVGKNVY